MSWREVLMLATINLIPDLFIVFLVWRLTKKVEAIDQKGCQRIRECD